jgi:hypothetical protein
MKRLSRFAASLTVTALLVTAAAAQSNSINGTLRGQITDPTGAPIPGATVTVKNTQNGFTRDITTDNDGRYVAPNLPLGTYSVIASSGSFATLTETGFVLVAGTDLTVDESLKTGTVATTVDVTSDAPIIEVTRTDLSRTISTEEVQNLPLPSRNPYNFILFQPGITGHPNPENGIPRTLNTNGLVDRVNFQLDGMVDTETDRYGLRLFAISDSYTDSVQTISNAFTPEFGNTAGVIFNVITPAGTNSLHGAVQYIWRPKAASSCPILQNCNPAASNYVPKPSLHVDDYVARAGGPILKNRVFLFGSYEKLKRAYPQPVTVNAATQNALLAAGATTLADFGTAPQVQRAQWVDLRADFVINRKNNGFIRYNYFRNNYPFNSGAGGSNLQSAEADFQDRAHIIGAQLITTFTPSLLNEFRGSWPYRNEQHFAGTATGAGPAIAIAAFTDKTVTPNVNYSAVNFGGSTSVGDKYQEKIPSFADNISLIHGGHSFKFGVNFQKNNDTQLADVYTRYSFPSVAAYLAAKNGTNPLGYTAIAASVGRPGAGYQTVFFGFFAQDVWQLSHKLTVQYGVRYDQYRAPAALSNAPLAETRSFRNPLANFAPRLGIAYTPHEGMVVRLSGGVFYEATPTNTWFNPLYQNGITNSGSFIATLDSTSGIKFPSSVTLANAAASAQIPTPSALTLRFKNEYTWNINAQIEQQVGHNDALTIGYVMTNGRNLQFLRNSNLANPIGTLADGRPVYSTTRSPSTRVNPSFNGISYLDIGSNSSYNALIATYTHRMSAGLSASLNYIWSHAISDTPEGNTYEFSNVISDPTNPRRDRGNSSINRPNGFNAAVVYTPQTHFGNKFVNGIFTDNNFAFLLNATSGDQQNETTSLNLNGDTLSVGQQRPLFVPRNTLRTPVIVQADLRYTRTLFTIKERVKPSIFIEGTNLLNRSNVTTFNSTATTTAAGVITSAPTFAPVSTLLEARILQFGARIDF